MNPTINPLPRNHVRVLDTAGSDLAHKTKTVEIDGVDIEVEWLSVSASKASATTLHIRVPADQVAIQRDGGRATAVTVNGVRVLAERDGCDEITDAAGQKWVDLSLLPTAITFTRDDAEEK